MNRRTQFRVLIVISLAWLAWAGWSLVDDAQPFTLRVLDDVGDPVADAVVAAQGHQLGLTGLDGLVEIDPSGQLINVSAPGHLASKITVTRPDDGVLEAVLKARVFRGLVVDGAGHPVADAMVESENSVTRTGDDGHFELRGAEPGPIRITRPAWEGVTLDWSGGPGETEVMLEPAMVKAVHISGEAVEERFAEFVAMTDDTELNALMVDLKDEAGSVLYRSAVPAVEQMGAGENLFDLAEVATTAREKDLYLIGRMVAFQDPIAARARPEMSVWDEATGKPYVSDGQVFLDPTDPAARDYVMELAVEACTLGLDEIQFDYIRFPDDRPDSVQFDGGVSIDIRTETIRSFLSDAVDTLNPLGCAVAADVFGFVTTATNDGGVGQNWMDVTSVVDVASPMLYPSHYGPGWFGYESPNDHPGPVVDQALSDGLRRLSRQVVVRPWLQDFGYDTGQVRAQIDVAESHGLGWMLWNAFSNVTVDALDPHNE
ncbi:MAG: putative glycoside hydrolase [Acidimicrobiia bacterium]